MTSYGVLQFPGSCDERDALEACARLGEARLMWHGDTDLEGVDVVVVPGGFSYGDYLRPGAIAQFSPIMASVREFADRGGAVLGICNGFQVLCEAGLLPGALLDNEELRFVCRDVELTVESTASAFTADLESGERLRIPVKHMSGRYHVSPTELERLDAAGQIVLRYAEGHNPNGSVDDIAGVANEHGNVMGLMPHPEHAVDRLLGSRSTDGLRLLAAAGSPVTARAG